MARKNPLQYVPREERPEFLALVTELMNVLPEQFPDIARQCAEQYHDAVLAGHVEVLDQMEMAYTALVYQLNGGTFMGCKAEPDSSGNVLCRAVSAPPGQVPRWGQSGTFLLEVGSLRLRMVIDANMLGNHLPVELWAVDLDQPFLSETGYRATGLTVASCLGKTVDQAAKALVLGILASEGRTKPIRPDEVERMRRYKTPGWLADALAGVKPDGQMAMFGDAPPAKAPLTNAQRQKALRERRKAQQLKPVMLTEVERQWLERLREQGGGEPVQGGSGDFATLEVTDAPLLSVWENLPTDFSRAATALGLLRLRNNQHAELARAVQTLKGHLMDAGLEDQAQGAKWYWNTTPLGDYRSSSAPEYMERMAAAPTLADELREAQRYLANAQAEIERLHGEQRQSFENNYRLCKRLKAAGLPDDLHQLPGE